MKTRNVLKPQDIVVLFRLVLACDQDWVIAEVANGACLSLSETHAAIKRLELCRLFDPVSRCPIRQATEEFLLHALKYVFPAEMGGKEVRGMPTAHAAPPLRDNIIAVSGDTYVWPCPFGKSRGTAVIPLYKTVPDAAQKSSDMYEFLALADALCLGRARERDLAAKLLIAKLQGL
jgi:hypothetical protein